MSNPSTTFYEAASAQRASDTATTPRDRTATAIRKTFRNVLRIYSQDFLKSLVNGFDISTRHFEIPCGYIHKTLQNVLRIPRPTRERFRTRPPDGTENAARERPWRGDLARRMLHLCLSFFLLFRNKKHQLEQKKCQSHRLREKKASGS
mgnify:CR=1 FL=1